jgi:nucleoprotein TPR
MAAQVDTAFLATAYSLPEATFTSLIDAPTQQLVQSLLSQLVVAANEFEAAKAEKLRTDVELEAAVRVGDSRVKHLKHSNEKSLKEVEALRKQLNDSGRQTLEKVLRHISFTNWKQRPHVQPLNRISTHCSLPPQTHRRNCTRCSRAYQPSRPRIEM